MAVLAALLRAGLVVLAGALLIEAVSRLGLLGPEGGLGLLSSLTTLALQAALATLLLPLTLLPRLAGGLPSWVRRPLVAASYGALAGVASVPVARALTSGSWIKQQAFAPALRTGIVASAAVLFALLGLVWFWPLRRLMRTRIALTLLAACGAALANARVLPGQYVEAHYALAVIAMLLAVLSFDELQRRVSPAGSTGELLGGALAFAALGALAMWLLPPGPRVAAQLVTRSQRAAPLFGTLFPKRETNVVRDQLLAMRMDEPLAGKGERPRGALVIPEDFNVILLVVDTLRADVLEPTRSQRKHKRFSGGDTPFLDSFVARSVRFQRAYAQGSVTHVSMPALFRSRESYDDGAQGLTLAALMVELGRYPVAVVPQYFMERGDLEVDDLLDGFAEVEVYERTRQADQLGLAQRLLTRVRDRPFFAWLHYYCVHHPGWSDEGAMPRPSSLWPNNYPRAVRWLDGQLEQLFATLEQLGLSEKTVVVLTSDHGEGLLDDGFMTHSPLVTEEQVRVPLTLFIPGQRPGTIARTVGNIDIVPTLNELLGGARRPEHRGESLVPLLVDRDTPWERRYASVNNDKRRVSVARGAEKHVFDRTANLHMHFDLARDPEEDDDLFDPSSPEQGELLGKLVEDQPAWFGADADGAESRLLLTQRMAEVDPHKPPRGLRFLLRLVRENPTREHLDTAARWFREADDERVRLLVLEELFARDPIRLGRLAEQRLAGLRDEPGELEFVRDLAAFGQRPFATSYVASRLLAASGDTPERYGPWLALVKDWHLRDPRAAEAIARILENAAKVGAKNAELMLALECAAGLTGLDDAVRARLAARSVALLTHPSLAVQAIASRSLGILGGPEHEAILMARLEGAPLLVRMATLRGLAGLMGTRILPVLEPYFQDQGAIMSALDIVTALDSPEAIPLLERLSKTLQHPIGRGVARKKAAQLKKRFKKTWGVPSVQVKPDAKAPAPGPR